VHPDRAHAEPPERRSTATDDDVWRPGRRDVYWFVGGPLDGRVQTRPAAESVPSIIRYVHLHEPTHRTLPNAGPAIKVNANQRYATDAPGAAAWYRACRAADVPTQVFVGRNTVPCGSTVGPLLATRLGIRTVDVGIPILSMHSARELCGVDDPGHLAAAATAFLTDPT